MANTNLSGDALSLAAAEAIGWENLLPDEGDVLAMREGSPCELWDDLLYATDNRLLGEMLEWLAKSAMEFDLSFVSDGDSRWRAGWAGETSGGVIEVGATPSEAVARCVVAVAKTLKEKAGT